jgi:hypothetical protein
MANPEHVDVVKNGPGAVLAWNRHWNAGNRTAVFDLRGADLRQADLTGADLQGADLTGANLEGANLLHADFSLAYVDNGDATARIENASLQGANLSKANLSSASFSGADLGAALLEGALLIETLFHSCGLEGLVLTRARLECTIFSDVDLSQVRGLDECIHQGPSIINGRTFALSRVLPKRFLRGCGLSDWEIEGAKIYDPTLSARQISDIQYRIFDLRVHSSIQVGGLFISYTHADGAFVDALEKRLDAKGIRFWRDIHQASAGKLDKIVDRAIRLNPTMVLVLSKNSCESDWVEDEARRARQLEKELGRDVLCPIALDDAWEDCKWSRPLRTQVEKYHILNFKGWQEPAVLDRMVDRLVEGLSIFYRPETSGD